MSKSKVAVLRTSPATVLRDYHELMNLAGYQDVVTKDADTALKINISWHFFFPGSSTTPWQLEGVIRTMKADGYDPNLIHGCHNRTVVIDAHFGERENKQVNVTDAHGLRNVHLYEGEDWINIRNAVGDLTQKFLCLNEVYPRGFMIPRRFIGENIIHLPTVKTHIFTTTTGAMKNAFGGLLNEHRHWTHPVIHETLVDLLMIQKKIHRGVFAVMDGTFAGDGPGPRCMRPYVKNVILASADQVAIDAVAAKLMGMDPMSLKFIKLAHDLGLGCGDPREIEIVGDKQAAEENWHFVGPFRKMTFASRMQHKIYWGGLKKPLEWSLKTWLAPWSYIASVIYHDSFWYPLRARKAMDEVLGSEWGRLFEHWENAVPNDSGYPDVGDTPHKLHKSGWSAFTRSLRILGTCIKEAPELSRRQTNERSPRRATLYPTVFVLVFLVFLFFNYVLIAAPNVHLLEGEVMPRIYTPEYQRHFPYTSLSWFAIAHNVGFLIVGTWAAIRAARGLAWNRLFISSLLALGAAIPLAQLVYAILLVPDWSLGWAEVLICHSNLGIIGVIALAWGALWCRYGRDARV